MTERAIVVGGGLSGLSAAHTVYLAGGNVLVLDKQGEFPSLHLIDFAAMLATRCSLLACHIAQLADSYPQVSSEETPPRPPRVSTEPSPAPKSMPRSATA
jgi:cation diffusion facilitator CzcD-associated flavoprotein CzcO